MKKTVSTAIITILVFSVIIIIGVSAEKPITRNQEITTTLTAVAEHYGLKDVKIHIGKKIPKYDFYDVTVESSNLEDLSYLRMYSLADSMNADEAIVSVYISNGNTYEIFPYTRSIYKNGEQVHNGYRFSQCYADTTKDDKKETSSSSNSGSGGSYSFYSGKSSEKDDDPYNAKKYSDEEDFYDDHYDDFFDYYDAEDYYRDHRD